MEPLPLGQEFIPLLCFQLLTNLLILWIALLKPQARKNSIHPFQKKNKTPKSFYTPLFTVFPELHKSAPEPRRSEMSYTTAKATCFLPLPVFITGFIGNRDGNPLTCSSLTSVTPSSSDKYPWGTKNPSSSSSSSPSSSSS